MSSRGVIAKETKGCKDRCGACVEERTHSRQGSLRRYSAFEGGNVSELPFAHVYVHFQLCFHRGSHSQRYTHNIEPDHIVFSFSGIKRNRSTTQSPLPIPRRVRVVFRTFTAFINHIHHHSS